MALKYKFTKKTVTHLLVSGVCGVIFGLMVEYAYIRLVSNDDETDVSNGEKVEIFTENYRWSWILKLSRGGDLIKRGTGEKLADKHAKFGFITSGIIAMVASIMWEMYTTDITELANPNSGLNISLIQAFNNTIIDSNAFLSYLATAYNNPNAILPELTFLDKLSATRLLLMNSFKPDSIGRSILIGTIIATATQFFLTVQFPYLFLSAGLFLLGVQFSDPVVVVNRALTVLFLNRSSANTGREIITSNSTVKESISNVRQRVNKLFGKKNRTTNREVPTSQPVRPNKEGKPTVRFEPEPYLTQTKPPKLAPEPAVPINIPEPVINIEPEMIVQKERMPIKLKNK